MKGADGYVQAYDCQVAVDAESHVIVAQLASPNAADQIQLKPIVAQIKSNTGRQAQELSADAGYCTEDNIKELPRRHIRGYVATSRRKHADAVAQGLPRGVGPRAIAPSWEPSDAEAAFRDQTAASNFQPTGPARRGLVGDCPSPGAIEDFQCP